MFFIQVGFKPLRILKKRNKALRKMRKLLKKQDAFSSEVYTVAKIAQFKSVKVFQ